MWKKTKKYLINTFVEPEEPKVEEKKTTNVNGIMAIILILALAGAGGYMYFNTTKNSKKKPTMSPHTVHHITQQQQ